MKGIYSIFLTTVSYSTICNPNILERCNMGKLQIAYVSVLGVLILFFAACSHEEKIIPVPIPGGAILFKDPYLIMTGDNTEMKIAWQTAMTTECSIAWGVNTLYDIGTAVTNENSNNRNQHLHSHIITGLAPGTVYFYRVAINNETYTGSFRTAPDATAIDLNFMVFGDSRCDPTDPADEVAGAMAATLADASYNTFILSAGDLVAAGWNENLWNSQFFDLGNVRKYLAAVPIASAIGNHDLGGGLFRKYFPYPYQDADGCYWSFDYGPVHVAIVDQYVAYDPLSAQYAWLESDLSASTKTWKFIVLHQPGWSAAGGHANDTDVQDDIQPLCKLYGVSIVFAGHSHYYARAKVNNVYHITTGGGGSSLYTPESGQPNVDLISKSYHFCKVEIAGNTLNLFAESPDGTVIDTFNIVK